MKKLFLIPILLITIVACNKNKESEKVVSVWNFNGQKINTTNTGMSFSPVGVTLSSSFDENIHFGISVTSLPGDIYREWGLDTSKACYYSGYCTLMSVGVNSPRAGYYPSPNATNKLNGIKVNGKVQFHLEPTWFINYHDPTDSVLVSGDFNEP